jgi:tetratricopeptide (TPR) repeat protein
LTEYEHKRLQLSREIGNRDVEGQAMMFCGQIRALYLGDHEAGLTLEKEVLRIWGPIPGRLFPMLRIAQILTAQGRYDEAFPALEAARPLADKVVPDTGRAGLGMVNVILFNALGDEAHLWSALEIVGQIHRMTTDNLVSQQYRMAAACEACDTHLKLAQHLRERDPGQQARHIALALESSGLAFDLYQRFGFVQMVECTSEEILYRHSQALAANGRSEEAADLLQRAYQEMMRKHDLIPKERPFRKTYLENIELHRAIRAAYADQFAPASAEPARKRRKTRKSGS